MPNTNKTHNLERKAANLAEKLEEEGFVSVNTAKIRDIAHRAGENVREFIDDKSKKAAELQKVAERKISRNPFSAVGLGVLGGMIISAILRRK